jgi:hypothetical protein
MLPMQLQMPAAWTPPLSDFDAILERGEVIADVTQGPNRGRQMSTFPESST